MLKLSRPPVKTMSGGNAAKKGAACAAPFVPWLNETPVPRSGMEYARTAFDRLDQKSMPPMPPPGGIRVPAPVFFFGSSATMASVVIRCAATEAAFWIAARTM
jgi:hypothetical protein